VGAVWSVYKVAQRLGLLKALGPGWAAQLALWQVLARVLEQGWRLSAVRLAQTHAPCEVLGMQRGFDENALYANLSWLSEQLEPIEQRLFAVRRGGKKPRLFLYDVTSSYLKGEKNAYGDYGYLREGKKGKNQIVIGLLRDEQGEPVPSEVFPGNTRDLKTFGAQVKKASQRFSCERATFLGERGMIKSAQVEESAQAGFHHITAITKPQIEALLKAGILLMDLFDTTVCEAEEGGVRNVLRRNALRAAHITTSHAERRASVERLCLAQKRYLAEHPRAQVGKGEEGAQTKIAQLNIEVWLRVESEARSLKLTVNEPGLEEASRLDGC